MVLRPLQKRIDDSRGVRTRSAAAHRRVELAHGYQGLTAFRAGHVGDTGSADTSVSISPEAAPLADLLLCKQEVTGSIPVGSTIGLKVEPAQSRQGLGLRHSRARRVAVSVD